VAEIEQFLTGNTTPRPHSRVLATILFTDIAQSTERNAQVGDREWRALLDLHDRSAERAVHDYDGKTVKHTGDGILATFDGPGRAVRCAAKIVSDAGAIGVPLRAGVHVGEVEVRGEDVNGMAVNIAARSVTLLSRAASRFHGRSQTLSSDRVCSSTHSASANSRECPEHGNSSNSTARARDDAISAVRCSHNRRQSGQSCLDQQRDLVVIER